MATKLKDNGGGFMTEEELKAIELLKEDISYRESDLTEYNETKYSNAERILINLVNRQQKEIEALREENFDTVYMQAVADFKDKIRKIINIRNNDDWYEDDYIIAVRKIRELLGD